MKALRFLLALSILLPLSRNNDLQATEELAIHIDPDVTFQTIDGFGASDAWRCQFVGKNWPLEKRKRIANLLFSQECDAQGNPQGIGLSLWRFYLRRWNGRTRRGFGHRQSLAPRRMLSKCGWRI